MVGKEVSKFDERGTTSTCVMCGKKHKKSLSPEIRVFKCINEKCQFEYPRDNHSCLNFIKAYEPALWQSLVGNLPTRTKKIQFNVFSCKTQSNTVHFKMHGNLLPWVCHECQPKMVDSSVVLRLNSLLFFTKMELNIVLKV